MKEIKKSEVELLEKNRIIFNSNKGYVDKNRNAVGFYKTKNKKYIEDKYVNIAKKLA